MKKLRNKKAFTLIELLVVVAIIAMLMGVLSVSVRKIKIVSKNLRQKAAFHAGEISLELFNKDFGEYPGSALVEEGGTSVTGAQRLAEAFFGRDDQGFNPKTKWHPGLEPSVPNNLYRDGTLKARKEPYFERKRVGFYRLDQLWASSPGVEPTPVFTDVFTMNRVPDLDEKVGMPILYFKADPTKKFRVDDSNTEVNPAVQSEYEKWVYNFDDNLPILQLPWLREPAVETDGMNFQDGERGHYKDPQDSSKAHAQFFYEQITQRKDGNFFKPHNKSTFLLISAGYDGIYGTKDDLTNFNY